MSTGADRALVIGGGVIGAACAYYLSRQGWQATIVDRAEFGRGCSHGNCGFVCPSHVLPLAEPGAVRQALRSLLKKNAPLAIRLRFDPQLWWWLWKFARRCNHDDMLAAGRGIQALLNSSRALYSELMASEAFDCQWETRGLLYVYRTPQAMEDYAHTDRLLREAFNVPARRFDGDQARKFEPALKPGLAGAWLYECDAHLRPDRLMASWKRILDSRGIGVVENCEIKGFVGKDGKAAAAETDRGTMPARAFVVAAGALTPWLQKHLGCTIPIQPGKGYSITMPRPARCPATPLIFPEERVAVTPFRDGFRLGSTMEFAGYDARMNRARLQYLRDGTAHYLEEPGCEPVQEEWFGWRPMTYDGLPIIDRSPVMDNVMIAAGHNMLGLSMSPATGKLVAEILSGLQPHLDPEPYRLARFR
jgi:D-amino-acid dehydrogenase